MHFCSCRREYESNLVDYSYQVSKSSSIKWRKCQNIPLNWSYSRDGNILIPQLPLCKVHYVLLSDGSNHSLNLLWSHSSSSSDDLSSNILCNCGSSIQRQKNRCLQLCLCSLDFGRCDGVWETGPLAEGKVYKIVEAGEVVRDEVDAPKTIIC